MDLIKTNRREVKIENRANGQKSRNLIENRLFDSGY
jgi:hypothetical protein